MASLIPGNPPAQRPLGTPAFDVLPAASRLRRVHGPTPAGEFNPTPQPSLLAGGRFDSLDGSYGYAYLGDSDDAAVAETLCRDLPLDGAARLIPWSRLDGRFITTVVVQRDLEVLVLHGATLAHVGASLALTKCEADQYLVTRAWAQRLRHWFPEVAGFRYRCRHDEDRLAWVLFDDGPDSRYPRARGALLAGGDTQALADPGVLRVVRRVLHRHNATLS